MPGFDPADGDGHRADRAEVEIGGDAELDLVLGIDLNEVRQGADDPAQDLLPGLVADRASIREEDHLQPLLRDAGIGAGPRRGGGEEDPPGQAQPLEETHGHGVEDEALGVLISSRRGRKLVPLPHRGAVASSSSSSARMPFKPRASRSGFHGGPAKSRLHCTPEKKILS